MRNRSLPAACLALLLLGLAGSLYKLHAPPGPAGEEATHVLLAQSLWHERDLTYDQRDLLRAYRVWNRGPRGLTLVTSDAGRTMHFGEPFAYALAAAPFYGLFGVQGLLVFNMALYLAMLGAAGWHLRGAAGASGLFLAGFFFASAAFGYVFRLEPAVFTMACLFFPLLLWQVLRGRETWRGRDYALLAGAGALLAAAFLAAGPAVLLGAPIAVDLLGQRRWKGLLALLLPALVVAALAFAVQRRLTGSWSPYGAPQRSAFADEFPIESERDLWQLQLEATPGPWSRGPGADASPRLLGRNLGYFLLGRHVGLLPYFPFALLALALYLLGPRDRSRPLLLAAVAGYCLVVLLLRPLGFHGGPHVLGNRSFALVYPALVLLPGRVAARRSLLLPYAAAGLWTAAAVAPPVPALAPEATPQAHVRAATFRVLPLELTLLAGKGLDGWATRSWGESLWVVPRESFFIDEPHRHGVWVRGASRSEAVVVSPTRLEVLSLVVYSLSPDNVLALDSGVDRVLVRFDSEAKRWGTPVDLAVRPAARELGFFAASPQELVYRIEVSSSDGVVPARRNPASPDLRYLGTFLDMTGGGM